MIIDILHAVFILPLEIFLGVIYNALQGALGSGFGIIILSLFVNVFLLKLTFLADKKARQISALKAECDAKVTSFKRIFRGAELHAYTRVLYSQKHFHPIFTLFTLGGLALQVPFFIAVIMLFSGLESLENASFFWISDLSKADNIAGIHILPLLMCAFTLINVYFSSKLRAERIKGALIAFIFLVLLYNMPSALVLYWTTNMAFSLCRTVISRAFGAKNVNLDSSKNMNPRAVNADSNPKNRESKTPKNLLARAIHNIFTPFCNLDSRQYQRYRDTSIFAILSSFALICIFTPFALYHSDQSQFDPSQMIFVLASLVGFFLFFSFIFIYLTSFFYRTRLLKLGAFGMSAFLIAGLLATFIFKGDYGAMDQFVLQNPTFMDVNNRAQKITHALIIFSIATLASAALLKYLLTAWKIAFFTIIVGGIIYGGAIYASKPADSNLSAPSNYISKPEDSNLSAPSYSVPYENELFSYSKDDKNIVIFVLDMFSGSHAPYLFNQFSEFRDALDGFTFFSNTISTTNSTIHSISTLIGGEHYSTYNMNLRASNLAKSIKEAFATTGKNFVQNDYEVGYFTPLKEAPSDDIANSGIFLADNLRAFDLYFYSHNPEIKALRDENLKKVGSKYMQTLNLFGFGLFMFSPEFSLRPRIYNNSGWFMVDASSNDTLISIYYSASFYAFSHTINTNAKKKTFKFLHSFMTHFPYGMHFNDGKCEFFSKKSAWDDTPKDAKMKYPTNNEQGRYYQHYDTEACALSYLAHYINELKKHNIYDNTQIFVVSDHGAQDTIGAQSPRADSLFLFKDFNSRGALKEDLRLMANYDIVSIFCENIPNSCANVPPNILKNYPQNRELIHTVPTSWDLHKHEKNKWLLNSAFRVRGNLQDKRNWQRIDDPYSINEARH